MVYIKGKEWKIKKNTWKCQSCQLFMVPWIHQAPLSMEFSRQEYWSGQPFSSPGDLPNPGIEPSSPVFIFFQFCFLSVFTLLASLGTGRMCNSIQHTSSCQLQFSSVQSLSHIRLFTTPWIVAHQAPLSVGFSRQEYWSKLPCPPPGDLPDPGIEPTSLMSFALAGRFFTISTTWEAPGIQVSVV